MVLENASKTISISIRRGSDGQSSSIVLPRDHHLAQHLERLVTSDSRLHQHPLSCAGQSMKDYAVVNALSSVVKYIHASTRHESPPEALSALFSSLRPPSERCRQAQLPSIYEHPSIHRPRSINGRKRITKHCKVLGCGNISVSRGLCRGHGGCHGIAKAAERCKSRQLRDQDEVEHGYF